jgi:hypothetical protein
MTFPWTDKQFRRESELAVSKYWSTRTSQAGASVEAGDTVSGRRSEVTGGQHMDGFANIVVELVVAAGFKLDEIRLRSKVELPGYYRSTKKWDIVVSRADRLCCALELKSQAGPSFGNNFNNRTEEALGTSLDFWKAYEHGFAGLHQPWMGYLFLLEDCDASSTPVRVAKTSFKTDPVFDGASYARRYEILCERMVLERHYTSAAFLKASRTGGGSFVEPNAGLAFLPFAKGLFGHLVGCT